MIRSSLIAFALLALPAFAQQPVVLEEMTLNENPRFDGVKTAMIAGAFDQEGLYAANAVMTAGSVVPPHSHPDLRLSVVIEGTMYLGTGDSVDAGAAVAYPAGSIALTPPGVMHWMTAQDGDVRILEIGAGPTATQFAED